MQYEWPNEVIEYYGALAEARNWDQKTVSAFTQTVEIIRALAANIETPICLRVQDDDEDWWFECTPTEGGPLPIRQIECDDAGIWHHYSWERLEDDWGGLSEMTIDTSHSAVKVVTAAEFEKQWNTVASH